MTTLVLIAISIIVVGLCVFGLCFNIIFKKDGKFPDGEIGRNKALRKQGIVCARVEDEMIWGKSKHIKFTPDSNCEECDHVCSLKELLNK